MKTDTQKNNRNDRQAEKHGGQDKAKKPEQPRIPTREKFDLWVKGANDGDTEAQAAVREVLDAHSQIWKQAGDLAAHAQSSLIRLITKGEFFFGESLQRQLKELREDLETPLASPLEKLAVERVVATWANLYHIETVSLSIEGDLAERKFWLAKQNQADRQFQAATKSLLMVQTMLPGSAPVPPLAATNRRQVAGPSSSPGGNGSGGNGHAGNSPVPAFGVDNDATQQVGQGNGHSANRIAALVGAGS